MRELLHATMSAVQAAARCLRGATFLTLPDEFGQARRLRPLSDRSSRLLAVVRLTSIVALILLTLDSAAARATDRLIFTQVPVRTGRASAGAHADAASAWDLSAGSRIVAFDPSTSRNSVTVLTSDFSAAGRPDLSFDGKRVLFIGRHNADDPLQVWEMNVDGSNLRRVTDGSGSVREAIYLSTLYTLDAEVPFYRIAFDSDACGMPGGCLYTCRLDGTDVRQITFDPNGVSDPYLLSDSRLLFSRWSGAEVAGSSQTGTGGTGLLTVHIDGTDVFPFAAMHEPPAVRSMPCETPDGWVIYVESPVGSPDRGGSLVAVARSRSLHTRRVLASDPDGLYYAPFPMGDGNLLVSYRNTTTTSGGSYGIYTFDRSTGTRAARVFDDPRWHDIDAVVVQPRRVPAGRSSVVDERLDHGFLYCMNAYISDRDEGKAISPGRIKRLQVVRAGSGGAQAQGGPGRPGIGEELLGEVPVEADGSFFLKVPARTPLRLRTIGPNGEVLQAMRSYIWVMPRENRGCIGCHEDRELTPPNRHVQALRNAPHAVGIDAERSRRLGREYEKSESR